MAFLPAAQIISDPLHLNARSTEISLLPGQKKMQNGLKFLSNKDSMKIKTGQYPR
jgi:hypothetical protein